MKSIFKYLAIAAMSIVLTGLVACGEKNEKDYYAFQYDGQTVAAGATVEYVPTSTEIRNDWASIEFFLENKTDGDLPTVMTVKRVDGPAAFDALSICYGETCKTGTCPWTSDAFTLVPGVNQNLKVTIDYGPSSATEPGVYEITIGKGSSLEGAQVMYLKMTSGN